MTSGEGGDPEFAMPVGMQAGRSVIPGYRPNGALSKEVSWKESGSAVRTRCRCRKCMSRCRSSLRTSCTAWGRKFGQNLDQRATNQLPWRSGRTGRVALRTYATNLQEEVLLPLGLDFLTFLAATVLVIPIFKSVKASPVLGFLFTGLILGQLG